MISVRKLSYSYGGSQVLKDLSFDISYGEFVGLIGPNGSGKTTLLKCLCKLLKPLGALYIDSEDLSKIDYDNLSRKISYLSSEIESPIDDLTVFEIVSTGRTPYMKSIWWESEKDEKIVLESIKIVGLDNAVNRKLKTLSSGEKQMARIARLLSQRPRILLVDEPTVHLDLRHQIKIMSILKKEAENGAIVIAVFHDLNLATAYTDKIIILKDGEIVAIGKPVEVLKEEILQKVYDVNVRILKSVKEDVLVIIPIVLDRD